MPARPNSSRACRWSRRCRRKHSLRAGIRHADRQAAGRPTGCKQAHGGQDQDQKAADLYYGTRRLCLRSLAGHRAHYERHAQHWRRQECRDGGCFGFIDAKDHHRLRGHHAGRAVSAKPCPPSFPSPPLRAAARMARFRSLPTSRTVRAASVRGVVLDTEGHILTNNHVSMAMTSTW